MVFRITPPPVFGISSFSSAEQVRNFYNDYLYLNREALVFRHSGVKIYIETDFTIQRFLIDGFKPINLNSANEQFINHIEYVKNFFRIKKDSLVEAYYEYIPPPFDFYHFYISSDSFLDLQYIKQNALYILGDNEFTTKYTSAVKSFPQFDTSNTDFFTSTWKHFSSWRGQSNEFYSGFSRSVFAVTEKEFLSSRSLVDSVECIPYYEDDISKTRGWKAKVKVMTAEHTIYVPYVKPCCLARCFGIPEGLK